MADISDVESALVAAVTAAIYPSGTSSPSAIALTNGSTPNCRIYAGWPVPAKLDADMAAGTPPGSAAVINVSVMVENGLEKNVTRYPQIWDDQTKVACTLSAAVAANVVTIGGTVTAGHYLTIIAGNNSFSYAALANDTLATIAAALAALMAPAFAVSVTGAAITLPATMGGRITVRSGAPGTIIRELERSNQRFCVTVWAPNNDARGATARLIRPALARIDYLAMPDTSVARLIYESSHDVDRSEKQSIACRDIHYWVEYATTDVQPGYPITSTNSQLQPEAPNAPDFTPLPWQSFTPAVTRIT